MRFRVDSRGRTVSKRELQLLLSTVDVNSESRSYVAFSNTLVMKFQVI
jgi:hypothetical protein